MASLQSIQQIQAIVDQVRITIMGDRYEETPEMRSLAEDFAEVCKGLNARMGRCGEYLRQGLRGEALEEAETEPKLLDVVAIVESLTEEELQGWLDLTEYLDLPTAEHLLDHIAIMLDEAYSEQEPLQKLLNTHRKLALQRAPLAKRLQVLRLIAEQDPNTEFWEEDVTAYETTRLNQMSTEIRQLQKSPSVERIHLLKSEIWDQNWSIKIPKKLLAAIVNLDENAIRAAAMDNLTQAEAILREAFSEMNFAKAQPAYDLWQQNFPAAEIAADHPLALDAIAALSWCEQEISQSQTNQEWDHLIARIESQLEKDKTPLEDLLRISDEAARYERPLPPSVGTRLETRIRGLQVQKSRFRILIGTTACVATLTVVGLITLAVMNANEATFRQEIIGRIASLLQKTQIEEAEKLVSRFETRWPDDRLWLDTESQVVQLRETLDKRKAKIMSLLSEAEAVPDNLQKQFDEVLQQATEASLEEPKDQKLVALIETESRSLKGSRGIRIRQKEASLLERISAQGDQLNVLKEELMTLELDELKTRSNRINQALVVLKESAEGYSPTIKEEAELLLTRVRDLDSKALSNMLQQNSKMVLSKSSRIDFSSKSQSVAKYENALNQYLKYSLESPNHIKMKQSLDEISAWKSLEQLNESYSKKSDELFSIFPEKISHQLGVVEQFIKTYPQSPVIESVKKYEGVLKTLKERHEKSTGVIARTEKLVVDDIAMKGLYTVWENGNTRPYYITQLISLEGKKLVEFEAWRQDRAPKNIRLNVTKLVSRKSERAPQFELTKQYEKQLHQLTAMNWESSFLKMVEHTMQAEKVDPILKMRMLMILQLHAQEGSLALDEHAPFAKFVNELSEASQEVNLLSQWADPKDKDVEQRRSSAQLYLKGLESVDLKKAWVPPVPEFEELTKELKARYRFIGMMGYNEKQQPNLDIDIPESGKWRIVIAKPGKSKDDGFRLTQIGFSNGGKISLSDSSTGVDFLPGRLVIAIAE